jgi:RNA polymerase sigma-70 factor (ECF subfamily)
MEASGVNTDAGGLAAMVELHRAELLRFLTARCGSPEAAEDLLHDLWLKASHTHAGPIANARAYLFRMANNLVLDASRTRQRSMRRDHAWLEDGGDATVLPQDRVDPTEPADVAIARREEAAALQRAIDDLPEGARHALRLYRFEGMGQGAIAQRLGISRSGVEKHLALAMKRLRASLADCGMFDAATSGDGGRGRGTANGAAHMTDEQR